MINSSWHRCEAAIRPQQATSRQVQQMRPKHQFMAAATALSLLAASAPGAGAAGVLGTLDPATGAFKPLAAPVAASAGTINVTGKFVATFSISVGSEVPAGATISCTFGANVLVNGGPGGLIEESVNVPATRTATSATCTATMPYAWSGVLATDSVTPSYTVTAVTGSTPFSRLSLHPLPSITVPSSGKTTSYSIAAVI